MKRKIATLLLLALTSWSVAAQEYTAGALLLKRPVADPAGAHQQAIGVYLEIINNAPQADRLIAATAPIATQVLIHRMEGGAGHMADAGHLPVPGKGRVVLAPGRSHIMLTGLKGPLKSGQQFPMKLVFERAGTVLVEVEVLAPAQRAVAHHH